MTDHQISVFKCRNFKEQLSCLELICGLCLKVMLNVNYLTEIICCIRHSYIDYFLLDFDLIL